MTYTTTAAAHLAGVTTDTIRVWCRMGAVKATKQAGRWIIDATYDGIELEDVTPDGDDHNAILVWNTHHLTIKQIDTRHE